MNLAGVAWYSRMFSCRRKDRRLDWWNLLAYPVWKFAYVSEFRLPLVLQFSSLSAFVIIEIRWSILISFNP